MVINGRGKISIRKTNVTINPEKCFDKEKI